MRASLIQLAVEASETAEQRRSRAAALVLDRAGDDLVMLPELWPTGAWDYDAWTEGAEGLDGPTAAAMSAAARAAGVWVHAGSVIERDGDGTLYNTALVFDREGELRGHYRKIHRYGFDTGEAVFLGAGQEIVTVPTDFGTLGLAICYDLRFPEIFRALIDAGADIVAVPAAWPAERLEHLRLFARTRAVEEQVFLLACVATGEHGGMRQAGHSMIVDPWGDVLAGAGDGEQTLTGDFDMRDVEAHRTRLPVLRDRVLSIAAPRTR
ncbi:nitrilase-related carbon-nitrogen hydrolase [Streptomyces sp. NPDC000410]|uniref:nitrilase-related carbon-nitrogen hydrolase n=1 Tax=Streptomyces sp. NPDC000410 TaxID=3154254 RepID=UPI0033344899